AKHIEYLVSDEAIHKELGDRIERAATTASSFEAEQCHIKYALTENPTIYVSLIEQFWQTATASTLDDGDMGITATIDGKVKVVFEASIRRHLKLKDYDGISTLSTTEIFEQLALMGASSISQPPTSSPSMSTTHVAEEATPMPHDSPIPRVHSLRSDEGSLTLNELTVKKLEHKVKSINARIKVRLVILEDEDDLEDPSKLGRKIAQIDEDEGITIVQMEGFTRPSISIPEEVSTTEPDMDVTLAEALVDLLKSVKKKSPKPKAKERAEQEEASRATIYEEMDNIQAMIEADEQLAARVQAEEQEL
ncbi:hypothetical protein Tco_1404106, partial [Tanacetum coccineum]